eukprot:2377359-Amphidinium_carterae.2
MNSTAPNKLKTGPSAKFVSIVGNAMMETWANMQLLKENQALHSDTQRMCEKYLKYWESRNFKIDTFIYNKLTSEYAGASDWVTTVGPDDNVVCTTEDKRVAEGEDMCLRLIPSYMKTQWHCPHCASKWTWGKSAPKRWIIIYKGSSDRSPSHFTWGNFKEEWCEVHCEQAIQWLRKVRLATELEKVKDKIDLAA